MLSTVFEIKGTERAQLIIPVYVEAVLSKPM
jgi:hypothetical protein